jgi:hypothetical protein
MYARVCIHPYLVLHFLNNELHWDAKRAGVVGEKPDHELLGDGHRSSQLKRERCRVGD